MSLLFLFWTIFFRQLYFFCTRRYYELIIVCNYLWSYFDYTKGLYDLWAVHGISNLFNERESFYHYQYINAIVYQIHPGHRVAKAYGKKFILSLLSTIMSRLLYPKMKCTFTKRTVRNRMCDTQSQPSVSRPLLLLHKLCEVVFWLILAVAALFLSLSSSIKSCFFCPKRRFFLWQ